jgi:putative endonuclease
MKLFTRKDAGDAGEETAYRYLKNAGLRLVQRNYRCKGGEIDLVMLDRDVLALIEVRFRTASTFGGAAASITPTKQRRLMIAARHLLLTRPDCRRYRLRFDVVAMDKTANGAEQIRWIKDAFRE